MWDHRYGSLSLNSSQKMKKIYFVLCQILSVFEVGNLLGWFQIVHDNIATLGSILDSQLS